MFWLTAASITLSRYKFTVVSPRILAAARHCVASMVISFACLAVLSLVLASPSEAQLPPLTYNAISNRTVYPYPPLPSLGSAGYQFIDPVFGSRMLRVTDANTRPDFVGRFWASPSSAETSAWNISSTKFYVVGGGGETVPYNFDPVTMTPSRMGNVGNGSGGLVLPYPEPAFSFVDPDLLYAGNGSSLVSYRFSTGIETALHDVHSCRPGIATREGGLVGVSVSKDDQRVAAYIGGTVQDADTTVYVYDKTLGCRWLDVQTGMVGGAWGPIGPYTGDRSFLIHNSRLAKSGQFVRITTSTTGNAGVYLWDVATLNLLACPENEAPNYCGGHQVTGFTQLINQRQFGDGMDFAIRPMSSPRSSTPFRGLVDPLLTPGQWVGDTHPSWNNVQADEKQPVCLEQYRPDNLVQRAWDGEIICMQTDGVASTVWRFAHHRTQMPPGGSFWDQPRANVSQDGRFVLFTSNWEQTLGTGPDGLRQDAFIVQLAAP